MSSNLLYVVVIISQATFCLSCWVCLFQGNRVLKDFDIKREAGGVSKRAIQREIKTRVSENYLEIHLFWAGKGTCCVPAQGTYGPSISAIRVTPGNTNFNYPYFL